ncbi:MAG: protein of unknown function (DUF2892) [Halonotius sp. J07HN4]|jgi:Protein of unknown function (DUF2892).|nr:MAG: protein of unknown function (DUF2892) [Halonotius sp. J07HN4]
MDLDTNVGGTDRLLRALGAVLLSIVAVRALTAGKRTSGLLAAVGAVGLGFNATTCFCGLNAALGIDTDDD